MTPAVDPMRRGWCPTVLRPMATGDGLLVRVHPRQGRLDAAQANAVAAAARDCGNGLVDLSSRGNLQIRGVRPETQGRLAALLSAAGLVDEARPHACLVSPLAGLDPTELIDPAPLAKEIEAALGSFGEFEELPDKFAVAIDGGGLPLDDIEADIRLVALDRSRLAVALAGPCGPVWIGVCAPTRAFVVVGALARAFVLVRASARDFVAIREDEPARRIRDLSIAAREEVAASVALASPAVPPGRPRRLSVGATPLSETTCAVGLGLAFGRLDADGLDELAEWSRRFGNGELRLSAWRMVFIPGVARERAAELLARGASAGLVVDGDDPRLAIAACPGAPACARASVATRADATRLAAGLAGLVQGATIHVSGCAKGCARRAAADLTLIGEAGGYGVVVGGDARQGPIARMDIETILHRLRTVASDGGLASVPVDRLAQAFAGNP